MQEKEESTEKWKKRKKRDEHIQAYSNRQLDTQTGLFKSNFSDTEQESDCNYLGVNASLRCKNKSADYYFKRAVSIILKGSHQAYSSTSHPSFIGVWFELSILGSLYHLDFGLIISMLSIYWSYQDFGEVPKYANVNSQILNR